MLIAVRASISVQAMPSLHGNLRLGFVLRLAQARREHDSAVVLDALQRRAVQARLVSVRTGNQGARFVRDDHFGDTTKVAEDLNQRSQPVHVGLARRGASIGAVQGAEGLDEDVRLTDLAGERSA